MDAIRAVLNRSIFITIQWMTFPTWARLLVENRFRVHPVYWPRAVVLTFSSLIASAFGLVDLVLYSWRVRHARVEAPIFIVGHFRSGTTHLHNLLALDRALAFPTLYETLNPAGFLSTEPFVRLPFQLLLTSRRPQDQVSIGPAVPAEDEVAIGVATRLSPYLGWVFPDRQAHFDRFLTLADATEDERRRWREGLIGFLRKVSWKHRRPLVLKSPTHTARLGLLLEMFPDARFIHIHRDPVEVFVSTRRLLTTLPPYFNLQRGGLDGLDDRIIDQYRRMYDAYLDQRSLVPAGQLCEVAFDDLERDPMGTLGRVYESLRLPGFERIGPELRRYLGDVAGYRKNTYASLPDDLARRLAVDWGRYFEAFGYSPPSASAGPHGPSGLRYESRTESQEPRAR